MLRFRSRDWRRVVLKSIELAVHMIWSVTMQAYA